MSVTLPTLDGAFVADPTHSSLQFSLRHMKVATFSATFDEWKVRAVVEGEEIRLDAAVRVDSISIKSPPEFREHVVYGADFFDARNHPELILHSHDVTLESDGMATANGELTMRGITRPFTATGIWYPPVEDPWGSFRAGVDLTATLDRRDWGLTYQVQLPGGADALGYTVRVNVHLELIREAS